MNYRDTTFRHGPWVQDRTGSADAFAVVEAGVEAGHVLAVFDGREAHRRAGEFMHEFGGERVPVRRAV